VHSTGTKLYFNILVDLACVRSHVTDGVLVSLVDVIRVPPDNVLEVSQTLEWMMIGCGPELSNGHSDGSPAPDLLEEPVIDGIFALSIVGCKPIGGFPFPINTNICASNDWEDLDELDPSVGINRASVPELEQITGSHIHSPYCEAE